MKPEPAIVLDRLAEKANDCWEAYGLAGEWLEPGELTILFDTLGARRREMAREFERLVRETGHRPRDRDTNSGVAHRVMARLKASFASERPLALVEECDRAESAFAHAMACTDDEALPPDAAEVLRACHAEVIAAIGQLAAVKLRIRGH